MFQKVILDRDHEKSCVYFDGNDSTNRMLDVLKEERQDVSIDEIDNLQHILDKSDIFILRDRKNNVSMRGDMVILHIKSSIPVN
jgi:hypothetical protein